MGLIPPHRVPPSVEDDLLHPYRRPSPGADPSLEQDWLRRLVTAADAREVTAALVDRVPCLLWIGPPQSGRSALLAQVARTDLAVWVPCGDVTAPLADLYQAVTEQIQSRDGWGPIRRGMRQLFRSDRARVAGLASGLGRLSTLVGKPVCLLIDDVDRSATSHWLEVLAAVAAARREGAEVLLLATAGPSSPAHLQMARDQLTTVVRRSTGLSDVEAREALEYPLAQWDPAATDLVVRSAGGSPGVLMRLAQAAWHPETADLDARLVRIPVTRDDARQACQQVETEDGDRYAQCALQHDHATRELLMALAKARDATGLIRWAAAGQRLERGRGAVDVTIHQLIDAFVLSAVDADTVRFTRPGFGDFLASRRMRSLAVSTASR